jgi:hypothetical protein
VLSGESFSQLDPFLAIMALDMIGLSLFFLFCLAFQNATLSSALSSQDPEWQMKLRKQLGGEPKVGPSIPMFNGAVPLLQLLTIGHQVVVALSVLVARSV